MNDVFFASRRCQLGGKLVRADAIVSMLFLDANLGGRNVRE